MAQTLRLAVAQSHTLSTTTKTLSALEQTVRQARSQSVDLILFPEAYLGGYPRTASFGAAVGARRPEGREQFLHYFKDAVDLGDTPEGAGKRWVERELEAPRGGGVRGDGTREELERIARETGVFVVTGCVERCGGTLYCAVLYVCPREGVLGKRRKVMPTGSERLIWGQGQPSSLRAVTTTIKGVKLTLASAICWENYMPLLRQSLYSQNVNLYLAPTADWRDTWLPLMRTVACEGRCVVLSSNQCMTKSNLPSWITEHNGEDKASNGHSNSDPPPRSRLRRKSTITEDGNEIVLPGAKGADDVAVTESSSVNGSPPASRLRRKSTYTEDGHEIALPGPKGASGALKQSLTKPDPSEFVSRGGSCIISPLGEVLAGPLWDEEDGLLTVDVDFEDCLRGRLDLDVGGSYSRNDSFKLTVEGLDISPPP
ncbi:carbon-nitrogen hydrolase [Cadophora sp. MPI-SDFR-AT-0126]|nr:carbon-nitrogen hydrolase [Leotiomycetes sp. MPI-SDFR-AT-0126]